MSNLDNGLDYPRVAFVDLECSLPNLTSQLLMPRHDVLAVATAVATAGFATEVYIEPLNGIDIHSVASSHVLGISVTAPNLSRARSLVAQIRKKNPSILIVAGGPHATVSPREVLEFSDVVVRDEGEATMLDVLAGLRSCRSARGVLGTSYWDGDVCRHAERRPYIKHQKLVENLQLLKGFRRKNSLQQLLAGGVYCGYVTTSRGCPFPCSFCYENMIGGTGHRPMDIEAVLADIRQKRNFFQTKRFWLADSNFTTNPAHAKRMVKALIDAKLDCEICALCRTEIGNHPDLLEMMREAGFVTVSVGMEALENGRLASIEKRQTVDQIVRSVESIHRFGLAVFGLFMVGFDGDTERTPFAITNFCKQHGIEGVSIYCLSEYPELPGRTLPRHRICEPNLDYYSGHFVCTFPKHVRPSVLEKSVFQALLEFYSIKRILAAAFKHDWQTVRILYPLRIQMRKMASISARHQDYLRDVEGSYYDEQNVLNEPKLMHFPVVKHPIRPGTLANWTNAAEETTPPTTGAFVYPIATTPGRSSMHSFASQPVRSPHRPAKPNTSKKQSDGNVRTWTCSEKHSVPSSSKWKDGLLRT